MAERFDGIFFDNDVLSRIAAAGMVEHVLAVAEIFNVSYSAAQTRINVLRGQGLI